VHTARLQYNCSIFSFSTGQAILSIAGTLLGHCHYGTLEFWKVKVSGPLLELDGLLHPKRPQVCSAGITKSDIALDCTTFTKWSQIQLNNPVSLERKQKSTSTAPMKCNVGDMSMSIHSHEHHPSIITRPIFRLTSASLTIITSHVSKTNRKVVLLSPLKEGS
jgi:hypothetical protein